MATYGLVEPPRYDLEMVTCPVMLYWGDSDWLAQPRGVATIAAQLPTLVESVRVRITVLFFVFLFCLSPSPPGEPWWVQPPRLLVGQGQCSIALQSAT